MRGSVCRGGVGNDAVNSHSSSAKPETKIELLEKRLDSQSIAS